MSTQNTISDLDTLQTEAVADVDLALDQLSVSDLVALMNERDSHIVTAIRSVEEQIVHAIEAICQRAQSGGRIIYVGAGTSGRLGVLDASEIPPTFGTDNETVIGLIAGGKEALVSSIESAEDSEEQGALDLAALTPGERDSVVGIASSGRTPYVLGALKYAAEHGCLTVGLACNLETPVGRLSHYPIEIPVGPEIVTGSTRLGAGTATKMVLNMISTIAMIRAGKTYKTLMVDVKATNAKLIRRAIRIVTLATGADASTASRVLDECGWNAKLAIATLVTGLSVSDAAAALEREGGVLGNIVEANRGIQQ